LFFAVNYPPMIEHILLFISLGGLVSSAIYLFLALIAAIRFRATSPATTCSSDGHLPPVTVLKPLCGMEPLMEQRLESFFRQDYPSFELIFGARNLSDPVLKIVESLQQKHPQVRIEVVLSGEPAYPNAGLSSISVIQILGLCYRLSMWTYCGDGGSCFCFIRTSIISRADKAPELSGEIFSACWICSLAPPRSPWRAIRRPKLTKARA